MGSGAAARLVAAVGTAGFMLWSCTATATSIVYPHFSDIEVFGDRFIALSPDHKTLRALTFEGRELWRRSFADPFIMRLDDAHLQVQEGNAVLRVRAADGAAEVLFQSPEHQILRADRTNGLLYLTDRRFEVNAFQLLDNEPSRPLWKRDDVESVLEVMPERLVAITVKRTYDADGKSFTRSDAAVTALDRKTGDSLWRVALKDDQAAVVKAASVAACLVVTDGAPGGGLLCIDRSSGRVIGRRANPPESDFFDYADVVHYGDGIAFLERGSDAGEAFLRFASVPSFDVKESIRLLDGEMFNVWLHGDFVLTQGLYSAACFDRRTGRRRWERGQVGDWEILKDQILLSDYDRRRRRARLVLLDIASGKERVLLSEAVKFP
jgi:outer membrane protein assembly factor BamB